jgi:hypothetical protein
MYSPATMAASVGGLRSRSDDRAKFAGTNSAGKTGVDMKLIFQSPGM